MLHTPCKYYLSRNQKGYATVLSMVLFSALSLSLFAMFNSGQIVTHKLKLQNAVDAATYSSVNVVARELNYMAYTNRAMVANQVAIGQMVGLASWSKQMVEASSNLQQVVDYLSLFPPTAPIGVTLQPVVTGLANIVSRGDEAVEFGTITLGIPFEIPAIKALSMSQGLVHAATSAILVDVFPTVLEANNDSKAIDDKIESSAIIPSKLFLKISDYIESVNPPQVTPFGGAKSGMADFTSLEKIIRNSDNGFNNRSYQWMKKTPFPVWPLYASIDKNGGNQFERKLEGGKYKWEWSAMDTVSVWYYWKKFGIFGGNRSAEIIPIGWGASHATNNPNYDYSGGSFWSSVQGGKWGNAAHNSWAASLAASKYSDYKVGASSELQSFYKFKKTGGEIVGPEFVAVVEKNHNGVRTRNKSVEKTTGNIVPADSPLNIEKLGNMQGNSMYVVSKAQVYFARSKDLGIFKRSDNKQEYGSLFNPYWQVRLADYTPTEIKTAQLVLQHAP